MSASRRSAAVVRTLARLRRTLDQIEAKRAHPEIAQRARAQAVLDDLADIPAAILVADNRGRYVDVNAAAARLTGYSRHELLRMSVWDLTPDIRQGLGRRLWRAFLERGSMAGGYRLVTKSGRIVKLHYFAAANVLPGVHVSALFRESRRVPRRRGTASGKTRVRKPTRQ